MKMSKISTSRMHAQQSTRASAVADHEPVRLVCMALTLALVALIVQIANVF
jgi:hypothetical protein